jgi:hypothetical protein
MTVLSTAGLGQRAGAKHLPGRPGALRVASLADFVTDHAADSRAADGSDGATARKNGASYGTDAGADGGILVLLRHAGTSTEAEQNGCGECAERTISESFSWAYLFVENGVAGSSCLVDHGSRLAEARLRPIHGNDLSGSSRQDRAAFNPRALPRCRYCRCSGVNHLPEITQNGLGGLSASEHRRNRAGCRLFPRRTAFGRRPKAGGRPLLLPWLRGFSQRHGLRPRASPNASSRRYAAEHRHCGVCIVNKSSRLRYSQPRWGSPIATDDGRDRHAATPLYACHA